MQLTLSNKTISAIRRLDSALQSDIVPVNDVKNLVADLRQKITNTSAGTGQAKTSGVKGGRKNKYRNKLKVAI